MFTNNLNDLVKTQEFKQAAILDGWDIKPTYSKESIDTACTLTKDNFRMSIITRTCNHKYKYETSINIWGGDGLCVIVPSIYNFQQIINNTRYCYNCKTFDVDTMRYSFAGRCCKNCLPKLQERYEQPGWCD